jgi:Na+-transporting NADH:ubiquinone oxidoreductase subunit D
MSGFKHRIIQPILDDNPITVQILGLCSALAVSSSLRPALIMAASVFVVLIFSNVAISGLRHAMPKSIRLIIEVTLIASAVIVIDEILKAFAPDASRVLSVFVGLIITNCIVLGRAESFALHNPVRASLADAIGNGLGYAVILIIVAGVRELLGNGSLLDYTVLPPDFPRNAMMVHAPSAFFIIGVLIWGIRSYGTQRRKIPRHSTTATRISRVN